MPFTQTTTTTATSLRTVDHEGNEVTLAHNGDATRYGAFLELHAATGVTVAAHLTPEAMAELGRFLLSSAGML